MGCGGGLQRHRPSSGPADSPGQQWSHRFILRHSLPVPFSAIGDSKHIFVSQLLGSLGDLGLFGWGPQGSVKQEVFWKPSVRSQQGDSRWGRERPVRLDHEDRAPGLPGRKAWSCEVGGRGWGGGECWGGMSSVLCRDDRLLTPALQRRARGWSWPLLSFSDH